MGGHLRDASERPCTAVEPDRLDAVCGLIRPETLSELAEVQQLPVVTVEKKQRRLLPALSQRNQRGPCGVFGARRDDPLREGLDRGSVEQDGEWKAGAEGLLDQGDEAHGQ